jgi:hypothetical protein
LRFFYITPLGLCLIIYVFYDYVTPLGLMYAHYFEDAQPFERIELIEPFEH